MRGATWRCTATRTAALGALRSALDGFVAAALAAGEGLIPSLKTAAARATEIDGGQHGYVDLGDFMREVLAAVSQTAVKTAAGAVAAQRVFVDAEHVLLCRVRVRYRVEHEEVGGARLARIGLSRRDHV